MKIEPTEAPVIVTTKWPALVPAIEAAGHEAVVVPADDDPTIPSLPHLHLSAAVDPRRCGTGYCTSEHVPTTCTRRPKGSVRCENFSYTRP